MMRTFIHHITPGLVLLALVLALPAPSQAQDRPSQRQIRTYVPPDQLVSFLPSTPFNQFVDFLNPIFERVTGKTIVDPESRSEPIGLAVAGMHFLDAYELVLDYNDLTYRETERFFIVEVAQAPQLVLGPGTTGGTAAARQVAPASLSSRDIQINAVLFDVNQSAARDLGVDWNVFFGVEGGQAGQGGGGGRGATGGGSGEVGGERFSLRTDRFFDNVDDLILAPNEIDFGTLTQFFRVLESEGVGETIANPTVTVQSGEQGNIQIGSDVPIQTRDFAGNTITQLISTGIIVRVTPRLITEAVADTAGAPLLDFIHLDVHVEKSSSRPSAAGPVIDRNTATTKVLLLNGEQTLIGGLYSTDESVARRGIPILKDLPGWFFGLRYIFGYTQRSTVQKELLIVLQARVLDPLQVRARRPFDQELLEKRRREVEENFLRVDERVLDGNTLLPNPPTVPPVELKK